MRETHLIISRVCEDTYHRIRIFHLPPITDWSLPIGTQPPYDMEIAELVYRYFPETETIGSFAG